MNNVAQQLDAINFSEALMEINLLIKQSQSKINEWLNHKLNGRKWPIYHSLDMRISRYKICHVDSNLFPSGFHRISNSASNLAIEKIATFLGKYKRILIIIEDFTRNQDYLNNICKLSDILRAASGAEVFFASINSSENEQIENDSTNISVYKLCTKAGELFIELSTAKKWIPDFILLNNDLTSAIPENLLNVQQPIYPNPLYGWCNRTKSGHFSKYKELIIEASEIFLFDHRILSAEFDAVNGVSFKDKKGLEALKKKSESVIEKIKINYSDLGINDHPYLFLKSDKGTFGMGIMEIDSVAQIENINKKIRHSMNAIKGGVANDQILIQEGINTVMTYREVAAESILYSVDGEIIGEMIRYNERKNNMQNLNSKGMSIDSIEFDINQSTIGYIKWFINKITNLTTVLEFIKVYS